MMTILLLLAGMLALGALTLAGWRQRDHRADRAEMARLRALQPASPDRYSPELVSDLPEPARRFLDFAILPGTPLYTVADIEMRGRFGLGTAAAHRYLDMTAHQVLAAPEGFVWKMSGSAGLLRMSGSDSSAWTRFWLAGLVPVARFGGDPDHRRSAFGRYVAEAAFWTPAALLPGPSVTWQGVDETTARYTMREIVGGDELEQSVDVTVAEDGRPTRVVFERWSDANPDKVHRLQPFGGDLSEFREFQGFRVPTHVEAGNFFGTEDYFPFFVVDVTRVRYPRPGEDPWSRAAVVLPPKSPRAEVSSSHEIPLFESRPLVPADGPLLQEYLHLALFVPEGEPAPTIDVVDDPALARYVVEWGRPGDIGYLALEPSTGEDLGAAWLRLWTADDAGYGFLDEGTPELSMAVRPGWRGRGIGSSLLQRLLAEADRRHPAVSLSVARTNPAFRLYRRCGFRVVSSTGGSATMLRRAVRSR